MIMLCLMTNLAFSQASTQNNYPKKLPNGDVVISEAIMDSIVHDKYKLEQLKADKQDLLETVDSAQVAMAAADSALVAERAAKAELVMQNGFKDEQIRNQSGAIGKYEENEVLHEGMLDNEKKKGNKKLIIGTVGGFVVGVAVTSVVVVVVFTQ